MSSSLVSTKASFRAGSKVTEKPCLKGKKKNKKKRKKGKKRIFKEAMDDGLLYSWVRVKGPRIRILKCIF